MTMPETPETAPAERSPDDTTEGPRDLLFNEICELFRNPKREWTLADELIALLARLGLLNSQPVRDAELERLRKRHVESFDAAAWHLNKVTKDRLKWEQESLVQQRRAEQAEAELAKALTHTPLICCDERHAAKVQGLTAERDALKAARCPSCDHLTSRHQPDGCWHTVTSGTPGRDLVCSCEVAAPTPTEETRHSFQQSPQIEFTPGVCVCGKGRDHPIHTEETGDTP